MGFAIPMVIYSGPHHRARSCVPYKVWIGVTYLYPLLLSHPGNEILPYEVMWIIDGYGINIRIIGEAGITAFVLNQFLDCGDRRNEQLDRRKISNKANAIYSSVNL